MASSSINAWFSKAFNWPVLEKSRWHWIDYLRCIAILGVVMRHSLLGIQGADVAVPVWFSKANDVPVVFRMALFFFLSGIFIRSSMTKRPLKQILGIKFENLFYPYLVWSVIQITIQILVSGSTNTQRSWIDYTYILYQPRNLDQFWYLPALFNASAIYMIIESRFHPAKWPHLALALVLYFCSHYLHHISMLSDWMRFYLFFLLGATLSEFFFKESTQRFLQHLWLLILMIPLFAIAEAAFLRKNEDYFYDDAQGRIEYLLIAVTCCVTMLVLAFRLQMWSWKGLDVLRIIGYHSLYIYVMHVIIAAGTRTVLMRVFHVHNLPTLWVACVIMGTFIPILFYNLLIKDNIFWFLFSYHRRKKEKIPQPVPVTTNKLAS